MEEKFDVIIVGGGIAGCVAGYLLAKNGLEVLLIERGSAIGVKNTSGGRIYAHSIEPIFENFAQIAPIERAITSERLSFMTDKTNTTINYTSELSQNKNELSYSVLRVKFDAWLGKMAEEAGVNIINGIRVDDLITKDAKICGVKSGDDEMFSDVVILADGANSTLCQKYGLGYTLNPHTCAVGVKEIIELGEDRVNDIFNVNENEGVAWLFAGGVSDRKMGGGFLYTNKSSISLGVVFGLHSTPNTNVPQLLENFKSHPAIKPLIKNGKTTEYSAHIVPEGGLGAIKKISDKGVVVVGDSAGFCLNVGYSVRGMDLAVKSAELAVKAIINAKQRGDFNDLSEYDRLLKDSFVLKDLTLYKNLPHFLQNERIFNEYPEMINGIFRDLFTINGASVPLKNKVLARLKSVGYLNLAKDLFTGVKSI
ncbi:FAD-dependent oxidoreductase [Campylobacter gastrosuis]|uniref:FAD-dependent oxidoreductase n=1 Tax=Campylobacter gastrosuis TaxID=2974576 RepID=A0ABT7HRL7_9BACT|nr:FAD-dependent oxidoreductase [Campylobacter gastrosuis]MDL0089562.1 FAD-dependent oxidoreductase [Campylobacter gastrosuis]